jgi:hypothetical protein
VNFDHNTKNATLTPSSSLAWNATYTATILGGSNGAKDLAGNALEQNYSWSFTTVSDKADPSTTHTLSAEPNAAGWNNSDVTVTLSATDTGGSGVKEIRYSTSGAQSIPETVYDPQNPPVINTEGTTTISYFATDNAGNKESPTKTFTVKIDKSAPPAPLITGPANNSFDRDGNITISGTAEANSTVEVFRATASGDASKGTTQADASGAWSKTLSGVPNGSHTYRAKAKDAAGNTSEVSNARTVLVDTAKPSGTVLINNGATSTASRTVTLKLRATDPAPASGVAQMRFSNDGRTWSAWQTYATSKSWTLTSGAGTKTVYVRYKDRAGNISAKAKDSITYRP